MSVVSHGVWLHVDAAYAGVMAMLPEYRHVFAGAESADSLVVNPHKWLFTPFDLSAFYCRRMDVLRRAFSLVPEYLRTTETAPVKNLMDTGVQLGRRFRALKLWMVLRYFGAEGIRTRLAEHCRLARLFASWVDDDPNFARMAEVPFSVVCFRCEPPGMTDAACAGSAEPATARCRECERRGVPVAHEAPRAVRAAARRRQSPHDRGARAARVGPAARARVPPSVTARMHARLTAR